MLGTNGRSHISFARGMTNPFCFDSKRRRETLLINCDNRIEGRNFGANLTK